MGESYDDKDGDSDNGENNNYDDDDDDDDDDDGLQLPISSDLSSENLCFKLSEETYYLFREQFKVSGYNEFSTGLVGGHKTPVEVNLAIKRVTHYLVWVYYKIYKEEMDFKTINIIDWLTTAITDHYDLLAVYANRMETVQGRRAATVVKHMSVLLYVARWVAHFKQRETNVNINLTSYEMVVKAVNKAYTRKAKHDLTIRDMEYQITHRLLPQGGLKALMVCVIGDLNVIEEQGVEFNAIDKAQYNLFLELLFASVYVCAPQGRIGGLMNMKVKHNRDILLTGYALVKEFKTRITYGYQPVLIPQEASSIYNIYVTVLRPLVKKNLNRRERTNDPFWLKWNGECERGIGRHVTNYFKRKMGLHITTTAIRSLVATETRDLLDSGDITPAQEVAIANMSGHSIQTTIEHYHKQNRKRDIREALITFNVLKHKYNLIIDNTLEVNESVETEDYAAMDWGTAHPDYGKANRRASWTNEEISYIGKWLTKYKGSIKYSNDRVVSTMLRYITKGPGNREARPIFHKNHVLDCTRLRHGYRKVIEGFDIVDDN
jgi:hypothetical protein